MLIQREQALKTYISEVFQKEEGQCEAKIAQIDEVLGSIEDYEDGLAQALEEGDIDMLKKFSERKNMVSAFNGDSVLKDLQLLNVAQSGLVIAPPT